VRVAHCPPPSPDSFKYIRQCFLLTSRETKRLEAVARSPVYAFLSETLEGLASIRAFRAAASFEKIFDQKVRPILPRSPPDERLSTSWADLNCLRRISRFPAFNNFRVGLCEQADAQGRCYFMFVASARWFGFRLDILCFILLAVAVYLAVLLSKVQIRVVTEPLRREGDPQGVHTVLLKQVGGMGTSDWLLGVSILYVLQLAGCFQVSVGSGRAGMGPYS
jgi:ABC-type multidrug transport system fused ATPase/permease subunit